MNLNWDVGSMSISWRWSFQEIFSFKTAGRTQHQLCWVSMGSARMPSSRVRMFLPTPHYSDPHFTCHTSAFCSLGAFILITSPSQLNFAGVCVSMRIHTQVRGETPDAHFSPEGKLTSFHILRTGFYWLQLWAFPVGQPHHSALLHPGESEWPHDQVNILLVVPSWFWRQKDSQLHLLIPVVYCYSLPHLKFLKNKLLSKCYFIPLLSSPTALKATDVSVLTVFSAQPSWKQTKQGHFYPVYSKHYFKQTSLSHQWCPVSRTRSNCSELIVALFKDSGLEVMKSYSNSVISSPLSLFAPLFNVWWSECPFIVIDYSSNMHFQDYKMKIHLFLDLFIQPTFLEYLGMLRHRYWCWGSKISWEMPSRGELNCQQVAITNLKQNAHLLCSFLYFSSFVFYFIFHFLSLILLSFSLFFPSFLLS